MISERKAQLALLLVTALWGLTFPLIRTAMASMDAYTWGGYRFTLALTAFILLALVTRQTIKLPRAALRSVIFLGVVLGVSYLSQSVGLETISSGRSAFITGTNVVIVPFLVWAIDKKKIKLKELISAIGATLGLFLLTDPVSGGVSAGDFLTLVCAFAYALYIVLLQKLVAKFPGHTFPLTFWQVSVVWGTAVMAFPLMHKPLTAPTPYVWGALFFCATLATIATSWLQTRYQRYTTPQKAALVFSMEPVFAVIFGYFMLGETMTWRGILGAVIILLCMILPELVKDKAS